MTRCSSFAIAGLTFALLACPLHSQQGGSNDPKQDNKIRLDVVVTNGSGKVASGLQMESFKLLDNGVERKLTSFSELTAAKNPVGVLIVIDSVNTPYSALSYQREQIMKYLRADGGRLTHVTTFAVLTDKGVQVFNRPSQDGTALATELEHYDIGLRQIGRDQGFYGAQERLTISLNALREIVAFETKLPGRKLVAWVSPGWPLLSGVNVELDYKQQQQVYKDIAAYSTQLRDAGITLDSVNSWGVGESLGRASFYETFLAGVSKPGQTQLGDLGLQVLATQSGGLVLNSSDLVGMLQQSVSDANDYYELSFEPAHSEKPNEYHRLQIVIPGYKARTRQSYYTQP
jgi:VWFA-related protein